MTASPGHPRTPIDWRYVRQSLAQAAAATEASSRLSPESARELLEKRARLLARVPPAPPAPGEVLQIVTFSLGQERYAIETQYVREVVKLRDHAPLPGAPPFVFGLLNLRGEVVAVMDLRPFFGVHHQGTTEHSRVLVIGVSRPEFGILVDDAHEVTAVRRDVILETPASVNGAGREYLLGVTSEALIVLDGAVLLRDGRLFVDQGEEA